MRVGNRGGDGKEAVEGLGGTVDMLETLLQIGSKIGEPTHLGMKEREGWPHYWG